MSSVLHEFLTNFFFLFLDLPLLLSIGIIGISLVIYELTKRDKRVVKYLEKFDGPFSLPIVGITLWFLRPNHQIVQLTLDWARTYKSLFRVWIGNEGGVCLYEATLVEKILSSTTEIEKSKAYDVLHKWLGRGLLTAEPKKWHGRRKLLTPAFHFKILEEFTVIFNEQGNTLVDILKNEKYNGKPFDIIPFITKCALDIICETAMGKKLNAQRGSGVEYVDAVYGYGDMLVKKLLRPWLHVEWIWKICGGEAAENKYIHILHSFTEKVILDKQRERMERKIQKSSPVSIENEDEQIGTKKRKAFLDLLLDVAEVDESLTTLEIREETDTFMFEGHDTTAANMSWTILTLSTNPEHQKRVQEELDEIFGDESGREITSEDISRMKYLEYCIKETLRLYPSVPFFFRTITQDIQLDDGRIIPKKSSVLINAMALHRDEKIFPNPEEFQPQRFYPENCTNRNPFAYVPFSAGPRNCIGQKFALLEEKTVLAKLFLNFNFESVERREKVRMVPDMILRPLDGIFVKLRKRF